MTEEVKSWKEALPAELKDNPSLKDINDVPALAKSFVETKSMLGSSLRIPSPEAGPEARKEFLAKMQEKVPELVLVPSDPDKLAEVEETLWSRLGKPKDAKEYEPPKVDDVEFKPEEMDVLRTIATKRGYTKKQFATLVKDVAAEKLATAKALYEQRAALKKEFGFAFDDKLAAFANVAEKTGAPPQLLAAIRQGTIDTTTAKWLDGLVKSLGGEGGEIRQQTGGSSGKLTPEEAKIQISEIIKNPAYLRRGANPELHEALKAKMAKLMPFAYPEDAARSA
jgi:hypothetical protein